MQTLACCGNDCSKCPRFASSEDSEAHWTWVADIWRRMGWREAVEDPRLLACPGCSPGVTCKVGIRACAEAHDAELCAHCERFPCERLQEAFLKAGHYATLSRVLFDRRTIAILEEAFFRKKERLEKEHRAAG